MDIFLTFAGHGLSEASMQVNFVVHAWCVFFWSEIVESSILF